METPKLVEQWILEHANGVVSPDQLLRRLIPLCLWIFERFVMLALDYRPFFTFAWMVPKV